MGLFAYDKELGFAFVKLEFVVMQPGGESVYACFYVRSCGSLRYYGGRIQRSVELIIVGEHVIQYFQQKRPNKGTNWLRVDLVSEGTGPSPLGLADFKQDFVR